VNKEFEKLVIHLSAEMAERLQNASEKLKLSRGSIIRQALIEFLGDDVSQKRRTNKSKDETHSPRPPAED